MGTINFGYDYNTRHSYQLMGEELSSSVVDSVKDSIEEELDAIEDGALLVENILGLPLDMRICYDDIEVEDGHYSGVRFKPRYYIEFDYKDEDEEKIYEYINEDYLNGEQIYINEINHYDSYESIIFDFISDGVLIKEPPISLSDKHIKLIEEYFDKVDEVLNRYLTPHRVGCWTNEVCE